MIETHAHIYAEEFKADIGEVIERSREVGVGSIYMPNIDHTSIDAMLELELKEPDYCIPMMGLHPCSVKKDFQKELYIVEEWLAKRKFVAVGEIGTDLYWDKTFEAEQVEVFKIQCNWAKEYNIPIIIHCRESLDMTIDLVEGMNDEDFKGVFHCFNGNADQAKRIRDMGFYIGLGGVSTFKNAGMDQVIPFLEMDNVVLETDSPYLAPSPNRGKRNEPSYLKLIAQRVADLREIDVEVVQEMTTINAQKLFRTNE
jgi:TatD DNase family protein